MPFRSEAQKRFLFARHPKIARRWAKEHPESLSDLPEHVGRKKKKKRKARKLRDLI